MYRVDAPEDESRRAGLSGAQAKRDALFEGRSRPAAAGWSPDPLVGVMEGLERSVLKLFIVKLEEMQRTEAPPVSLAPSESEPHVVIIGAGFGGLEAAKALLKKPVRLTVVDRSNHHLFQPLLYQVATAGLSPAEIAIPIRSVLRGAKNTMVLMARVTDVDLEARKVRLSDGEVLHYDYLVIAAGACPMYFGHDEWRAHAPPLKSVENATEIRREILLAFERADRLTHPEERRRELTFAVVGGGPTGVELAGALAELSQKVLASDFLRITPDQTRVVLIEGGERLLPGMSEDSSTEAVRSLREMGVEVRLSSMAKKIDERGVHLDDEVISAETVIWAAGVAASPLARSLGVELDRGGRIIVENDCSVPGHPEVFAIGDIARFDTENGPLPGVSPVAMQQGRYVAKKILRTLKGKETEPFEYNDRGYMATIGRRRAVADTLGVHLKGFIAWLAWLFVHLFYLVGFKNRVFVLFQWIFSYVFYRRGARLITHTNEEEEAARRRRRLDAGQGLIPMGEEVGDEGSAGPRGPGRKEAAPEARS